MSEDKRIVLECEECRLDCRYRGCSPMEIDDKRSVSCTVMMDADKECLIAIPTGVMVGKDGNVGSVRVEMVNISKRKSRWRRAR